MFVVELFAVFSSTGIVNIPARIFFGFVADRKIITAVNLNTMCVLIGSVPLFSMFILQKAYWSQLVFAVVFALGIGMLLLIFDVFIDNSNLIMATTTTKAQI